MSSAWRPTMAQTINPPPPGADPDYDLHIIEWREQKRREVEAIEPPIFEDLERIEDPTRLPDFEPTPEDHRFTIPDDGDGHHLDMGSGGKASAADRIVVLALSRYDLGRAEDGEPFALAKSGGNVARMFRGGRASLRADLAVTYAREHRKVPPAQALVDALAVLEGQALGKPRQVLPLRAGRHEDGVIIDLGDERGRAIMVRPDGWERLDRSPVTFRRSELTGSLPEPDRQGDRGPLWELLNVIREDQPLVLAYQVAALLGVPTPVLLFRGPAGAAKTTAARTVACTIDPSPAPVRSAPRDPEGWAVTAGGSYVVALDNISTVPEWLSDCLCRAVTGEGYLRRALYSDAGISVVAFRRAIIMTTIDAGAVRGDLADRLLAIDLAGIEEERRRDDQELDAAFRAAHPAILGGLLDLTSTVLLLLPHVRLRRKPRMADFARVLAAVDEVLGTNGLTRYVEQRGELQREAAEGDRIGSAVIAWMDGRAEWEGTATDLLEELTPERPPKGWPTTPRGLSGALRRVAQPLAAAGVVVTFSQQGHDKRRTIRLEEKGIQPSAPSAEGNPSVKSANGSHSSTVRRVRRPSATGAIPSVDGTPAERGADGADGPLPTLSGRLFDPEYATDDDGEGAS